MDKDEKFNIFNGYNTHTILEICKRCTYVFIVQGAGHCPNTLSTTVHGQASRIITRQPPPPPKSRGLSYPRHVEPLSRSGVLSPENLRQYGTHPSASI